MFLPSGLCRSSHCHTRKQPEPLWFRCLTEVPWSVLHQTENHISYQRYRWIRSHPALYPKDSVRSSFHSLVDLIYSYVSFYNCCQDRGRACRGRNTLSSSDQLAVQFRNNQTDCLSSTCAVRNDIAQLLHGIFLSHPFSAVRPESSGRLCMRGWCT